MTTSSKIFALTAAFAAVAGATAISTASAFAGDGKEVFVQDYRFKKPMHGYSGHAGNYYCDYQRLPERKCVMTSRGEKCKIVGWTLREMCH